MFLSTQHICIDVELMLFSTYMYIPDSWQAHTESGASSTQHNCPLKPGTHILAYNIYTTAYNMYRHVPELLCSQRQA